MSTTTFPDPLPTPHSGVAKIAGAVSRHDTEGERQARQLVAEAKIASYVAKVLAAAPPLHPVQRERLCSLLSSKVGADGAN